MNNGKVRIYELAKELNLDNRDILAVCDQLNISVKSHSSTITEAEATRIRITAEKYVSTHASGKSASSHSSSAVSKSANSQPPVKKQQIFEIRKNRPLVEPPKRSEAEAKEPTRKTVKKQQILEIRKNRPLVEPPKRPEAEAKEPTRKTSLPVRRTSQTRQGYVEPLLKVSKALPLHMVLIPGGTFLMGSLADELGHEDIEAPQHHVTLPQFFMSRYPITQAQWRTVAAMPQIDRKLSRSPSRFNGTNHPVEQVSWHDAVEFCARLEKHTKRPYRLPTEAEWEYACRAGTNTPFYFGKTLTDELANYDALSSYADEPTGESRRKTTPVNYFGIANAFGLSDMHGNVWEWCQDHSYASYKGAPMDGSAWLTSDENASRILRGGAWFSLPGNCRSASRSYYTPDIRNDGLGFRVVCSAPRTL